MYLNYKKFVKDYKNGQVNEKEKYKLVSFAVLLTVFGWAAGMVDFASFFSDIPGIIIIAVYLFILLIPFIALKVTFGINQKGGGSDFTEKFVCLSSVVLIKLSISYAVLIILYVAAYTLLKEFANIVYYEVQYYFTTALTLIYGLIYLSNMKKSFHLINE